MDYWEGNDILVCTFWLADQQYVVCVRIHVSPSWSRVGVRGAAMSLCSWALAHPWSRHLYNSICVTAKWRRAPAKTLAKCQGERERPTLWAVAESKPITEQHLHLQPSHNSHSSPMIYYTVAQRQRLNFKNTTKCQSPNLLTVPF